MSGVTPKFKTELERQLWLAIQAEHISYHRLSVMSGVPTSVLSHWKHGRRGLSTRCLDALAQTLGLVLARKTDLIQRPTKHRRTQAGGKSHGKSVS